MLANLFIALDRDNWPDGTEDELADLSEQWKAEYNEDFGSIEKEYMKWLCSKKWHILHAPMGGADIAGCKEKAMEYEYRYNKNALIHAAYLDDKSGITGKEKEAAEELMEYELSQIKLTLQNRIDDCILSFMLYELVRPNDLTRVGDFLQKSEAAKYLSKPIFVFITDMLNNKITEDVYSVLSRYLASTLTLLDSMDNMYMRQDLMDYVTSVIEGNEGVDTCCERIYRDVFVKIQSEKCNYYAENKKAYRELENGLKSGVGNMLVDIIKESENTARKTIVVNPMTRDDKNSGFIWVTKTGAIVEKECFKLTENALRNLQGAIQNLTAMTEDD